MLAPEATAHAFHVGEIAQIDRRVEVRGLRIASAEHTVACKLLYGTPQDLADARSIVIRQAGRLDLPKLRAVARDLAVETQLDALLREAADE